MKHPPSAFSSFSRAVAATGLVATIALVAGRASAAPLEVPPARRLSLGSGHSCVVLDGRVNCWGRNDKGQLGDGTTTSRSFGAIVPGLVDVVEVAAGGEHTCALRRDGRAVCWGDNSYLQLGYDSGTPVGSLQQDAVIKHHPMTLSPRDVPGLTEVRQLGAGSSHTCARVASGRVFCWGWNGLGQAGVPIRKVPGLRGDLRAVVEVVPVGAAVEISVGSDHGCARRADGTAMCWGFNGLSALGDAQLGDYRPRPVRGLDSVVELSAGGRHTCARRVDGQVWCWGHLGGSPTGRLERPTAVASLGPAAGLASGFGFSCARLPGGALRCWGFNDMGQLGDGTVEDRALPVPVKGPLAAATTEVAAGNSHACARRPDQSIICWGWGERGQLGEGSGAELAAMTTVANLADVVEVGVGQRHSCARRRSGVVLCWGGNVDGQLGQPPPRGRPLPVPVLDGTVELKVGARHTCARRRSGKVVCFGEGAGSKLGHGDRHTGPAPADVVGIDDAIGLAVGDEHSCALRATGTVACWGNNFHGQLGLGNEIDQPRPVAVLDLSRIEGIAAGSGHTCALQRGQVLCWGENRHGQLGDGTLLARNRPVAVPGLTDAVELALGAEHSCARRRSGEVVCWGARYAGQLGDGTVLEPPGGRRFHRRGSPPRVIPVQPQPRPVGGLTGVVQLASGTWQSCAIQRGGSVLCWGRTFEHPTAGRPAARSTPTPMGPPLLGGVIQVSLGSAHGCAVQGRQSRVVCWGSDSHGQLGGGRKIRPWPTAVKLAGPPPSP